MLYLKHIAFCAEECARQHSGEISVYNMCYALEMAKSCWQGNTQELGEWLVLQLAQTIEPSQYTGYRTIPVTVNGKVIPTVRIPERVRGLIAIFNAGGVTPEKFYKEFEEIHPFVDGNGRVGAILYNFIRGSINNPIAPPDAGDVAFWEPAVWDRSS